MSEANPITMDTSKNSKEGVKDSAKNKEILKELQPNSSLKLPSTNSVLNQQDKTLYPVLEPVKPAAAPTSVIDGDKKEPETTSSSIIDVDKKEPKTASPPVVDLDKKEPNTGAAAVSTSTAALEATEELVIKQKKEQEDNAKAPSEAAVKDKKEMELKEQQLANTKEKEKEKEVEKTKEASGTASKSATERFAAKVAVEVDKMNLKAVAPDAATVNAREVEAVIDKDADAEKGGEEEGEETADTDKEYVEIQVNLPLHFFRFILCIFILPFHDYFDAVHSLHCWNVPFSFNI